MAQLNNLIVTGSSRFLNKVYFSNGGTFNGNININNGELQIYGKTALMGYDSWLRINEPKHFTSGIYCGNGTLRTDGEFQVGEGGNCFKANSSAITCNRSLIVNAGVDFGYGATIRNAGLELYFSTPFIDFHYNNSSSDYTSRIIEGSQGIINVNGSAFNISNGNMANTSITTGTLNVSSRINADAATAIFNNVYVKDELRSTTWAIDNITNLGSTFYVSPCIIFTNPSVYINSKSGTTVTLTITDNNIISSTIGGQTWTSGSKIKLMGRINTSVLGVVNGTMARQLNTTTAKTAYITLNFATTDDCAGIEQGKTYSGSAVGDLKMMMYEVNLNVNGTTKNRPVGIRMSSYNEDKKSSIDIYNGTVEDGSPVARMGYLNGLPSVNGVSPTGYGFYAAGNAYFSGTLVSSSGKIGGFSLSENSIQNGSFGKSDGVLICTGTNSFASIGGSDSINGWCFTASNTFGVTKTGALYASNATIAGNITATSGKIGKYRIDDYLITGSGSTCTGMGGNQAFWAGSDSSSDAPFHVSYDGKLYASNANISGIINSTDGSIGGWKIENSSIYSKSTDGLKQTSLNSDSQKIEFKLTRSASTESDESSSFLNISNSNLSPYIELGWMTTDSDGNAYWGNRNYISEDSIAISSKADIDSSVTISSNDIILSDTGDKLTISPGYLQFENGVSISPNQDTLWSGADYMNENQTISLNGYKNISKQLSGICLAFTYYDRSNNSVKWYGMHYYFVPKSAVAVNNGGGTAFTDAYRGINKYLYIYNDKIIGAKQNGRNGSEGGFSYDNRNWVLVKVFGV